MPRLRYCAALPPRRAEFRPPHRTFHPSAARNSTLPALRKCSRIAYVPHIRRRHITSQTYRIPKIGIHSSVIRANIHILCRPGRRNGDFNAEEHDRIRTRAPHRRFGRPRHNRRNKEREFEIPGLYRKDTARLQLPRGESEILPDLARHRPRKDRGLYRNRRYPSDGHRGRTRHRGGSVVHKRALRAPRYVFPSRRHHGHEGRGKPRDIHRDPRRG